MKKMKKVLVLAISLLILMGTPGMDKVQAVGATEVGEEQQIPEGYTPIYDIADLYAIRNNPSGNYILMNDIDMTEDTQKDGDWDQGNGWTPIESFSGIFDGNGYRIIGMQIFGEYVPDKANENIGLFAKTDHASISNLGIKDCAIDVVACDSSNYGVNIGGIVGYADEGTTIQNCYVTGNMEIQGDSRACYTGGVVGYAGAEYFDSSNVEIVNCYNMCSIDCSNANVGKFVGGIIGYARSYHTFIYTQYGAIRNAGCVSIKNCYNRGVITGSDWCTTTAGIPIIGALCGYYRCTETGSIDCIKNSYYLKGSSQQGVGNQEDGTDFKYLTEAQMKTAKSFTGYDFTHVWEIDPYCSYPYPQLKNNHMVRVASIVLQSDPAKLVYNQGDKLDISDTVLDITYDDGITTSILVTADMLSGYDMDTIGTQTVTVNYGGIKTTFEIEVKEIPVTSVTIPKELSLYRSKTQQLSAVVLPENATDKTVTWESDNPDIASVDDNGLVRAKAKGTATITVTTAYEQTAKCEVTVLVPAASISLDNTAVTLKEGENIKLTAKILPLESTDDVEWTTSNADVAEVYEETAVDGQAGAATVVAKQAGTATITACTESGVKVECVITVQKVQTAPGTQTTPGTAGNKQEQPVSNPTDNNNAVSIQKTQSVKVAIKAKNVKKKSVKLTLSGLSDCDGYQIQYSTNKNFKSAKKINKKNGNVTIKKLKKGKKYYFRARAYKKIGGKTYYGKWSGKKSVKIKK